eukprot:CAMPEP_0173423184 /NCGR_PEP_ID=MMETSP1357-20121228/3592_1 /TAXON_ID=77926 /ORGANISM="Hemiselmis rufescens, Strain PCC563" /LENGTH=92 /DNA_ID=CAMNT_0014386273 /DNA_START=271 /DNA_END=546 /DNA_ORIENTATION=+
MPKSASESGSNADVPVYPAPAFSPNILLATEPLAASLVVASAALYPLSSPSTATAAAATRVAAPTSLSIRRAFSLRCERGITTVYPGDAVAA